ncbi:MAG: cupin domain-containing protein [Acidimicrobiia bacterium]|nr:cupin domain-containing protein [Acidimicrobiia bacterium]
MLAPGVTIDIGDHTVEVLANPAELGDRYRLRIVADPGGPGIDGDFPHLHPRLVETFHCVSGNMKVRVGSDVVALPPGESVEVSSGTTHGFLNDGSEPLIVESEVIFPDGYRHDHDLMRFAAIYDGLRRTAPLNPKTGEPPVLQMAVLMVAYDPAIRQPGMAGMLMKPLAAMGRLRGYRAEFPEFA